MERGYVEWAGVPFMAVHHHDGRFFRQPGLFGLVRRSGDQRALLYVGEADDIAAAFKAQDTWAQALSLGLNELHLALHVVHRIDRLLLRGHLVKRCEPLLNRFTDEAVAAPEPSRPHSLDLEGPRRIAAG